MITLPAAGGVPAGCVGIATSEEDKKIIRNCAEDMRRLIDNKYYAYRHDLFSLATTGNTTADAAITVAGVVGTVVAPPTTKWLSALVAGISGLKETANTDLLYKNSILLILLQMDKDRASQNTIVQKNLDASAYQTMGEAATDLYSYFIAGTWDDALLKMQSDAGAQAAQCEAELKNAKLNAAASQTAAATATSQCGATKASSATPLPAPVAITFAIGKTTLESKDKKIVASAATQFKASEAAGAASSLAVLGGATAPSNDDNKKLAAERAQAVVDELVADGIAVSKIRGTSDVNGTLQTVITFSADKLPAPEPVKPAPVLATPPAPAAIAPAVIDTPLFGTSDLVAGASFSMKDGTPIKIVDASDAGGNVTYVKAVAGVWDAPTNKISAKTASLISQLASRLPADH